MLNFQPYNDQAGENIRNRWSQSLDGILNQYMASKQQAISRADIMRQQALQDQDRATARQVQDLQLREQYGTNPLELTPEQRAQGFAGPTIIPAKPAVPGTPATTNFVGGVVAPVGTPASQLQAQGPVLGQAQDPREALGGLMNGPGPSFTPSTPGTPATPEQTQFHDNPAIAALQRHVMMKRQQAQIAQDDQQAQALQRRATAVKDIAEANLADRKPFDIQMSEKENQFKAKRFTQLGDALDPSKARAGAFGTSKQVFDRAERLQTLAGAYKDNNLDSRQVEELAIGLNSMLSGSNVGAASQVEKLVPKSIVGDVQKMKEWLTNDPKGTNQQEFVKRMLGSIEREKSTAQDQIKRTQFERIGRYGDLEKADPDEFVNVLQSAGVDPAEYQAWKKGGFKRQTAVQSAESGAAPAAQSGPLPIALTGPKAARLAELRAKLGAK